MGLIPFGKVLRAHGLSGELKVFLFSGETENLQRISRVFIKRTQDSKPQEYRILAKKAQKNLVILKLEGLNSTESAEKLKGSLLMIESSDLPELGEDEYYWFQLMGLKVYTDKGEYVGRVEQLIDRALQSLLVVKNEKEGKEILIPMVDAIVKEINIEKSEIVITPIKGLLD
ncbi:Ribosome maturation factor RimM [bacterium HR37]|jgi:16S rRNA processing protein RimM|nr:Ribosome maturation factor RimM [bacterium HR37]